MKRNNILALLLALIMCTVAVSVGAKKGWTKEKAQVDAVKAVLEDNMSFRAETAANILTVAQRYLPADDPALISLAAQRNTLLSPSALMTDKAQADARMNDDARAVLDTLSLMDAVNQNERDRRYVTALLPQMLEESGIKSAAQAYNKVADSFNQKLTNSLLSGKIAGLFGIEKAVLFE